MGFSCRKSASFTGVHKIDAAISGPRIADTNFTDTRIFLTKITSRAEMSRNFSTSTGNHLWELSAIFSENYCQYWFLPVLRPQCVSTSSGKNESRSWDAIVGEGVDAGCAPSDDGLTSLVQLAKVSADRSQLHVKRGSEDLRRKSRENRRKWDVKRCVAWHIMLQTTSPSSLSRSFTTWFRSMA